MKNLKLFVFGEMKTKYRSDTKYFLSQNFEANKDIFLDLNEEYLKYPQRN